MATHLKINKNEIVDANKKTDNLPIFVHFNRPQTTSINKTETSQSLTAHGWLSERRVKK